MTGNFLPRDKELPFQEADTTTGEEQDAGANIIAPDDVSANHTRLQNPPDVNASEKAITPLQFPESLLLNTIMRNSLDTIYFKDINSKFVMNNMAHARQFHIADPRDMVGKCDSDFFTEEYSRNTVREEQEIIRTGIPLIGHIESYEEIPGKVMWFSASKYPLYDENGKIIGTWGISRDITEYEQTKEALRDSEERHRQLSEQSRSFTWEVDELGLFSYVDPISELVLGYRSDELIGRKHFYDLCPEGEQEEFKQAVFDVFRRKEMFQNYEYKSLAKDGHVLWLTCNGIPMLKSDGNLRGYRGSSTDISERKQAEMTMLSNRRQLTDVIEFLPDATVAIDNNKRIIIWNKAIEKMTGIPVAEMIGKGDYAYSIPLYGVPQSQLMDLVFMDDKKPDFQYPNLTREGDTLMTEVFCPVLHNNEGAWVSIKAAPLHDQAGSIIGAIESLRDITDQKQKEKQILYLSYHDQLTGLYNRRFYEEELMRLDTPRNLPLAIIMGDVNGLKITNDSFGHDKGDELLMKSAEMIKKECRADEIVARLGGDEFVMILPQTASVEAEQIIERIKNRLAKEKVGPMDISISFGYGIKQNEKENILDAYKNAEDQMYRNKLSESSAIKNKTIIQILNTLYEKSSREQLHSIRVSEICEAISTRMNFNKDDIAQIKLAGLLHDIGKIEIDKKLLNEPNSLNKAEWEQIRRHPEIGYRILSSTKEFSKTADYVLEHQERWDGKGYPRGLKGEEISIQARIVAVADSYDAMTTNRIYGKALTEEDAVKEIKRCSGTQFDPRIARVLIESVLGRVWE
ncbi:MAG: PAS domain S-box protein [Eubacteriales bacterium]